MNLIDRFLHNIAGIPLFFPPDVYERHRFVAAEIDPSDIVLDVGGELGQLKKFATARKIVIADIHHGDIPFDGKTLPLKDQSFRVVSAIDVLEHIQKKERKRFVRELWRVTRKKLILAVPFGTRAHIDAERRELDDLRRRNASVRYLEEHVVHGLPTLSEIEDAAPTRSGQYCFAGDFRWSRLLFRWHHVTTGNGIIDRLLLLDKLASYILINVFFYPIIIRLPKHEHTNRLYVIWERRNK